MKQHTLFLVLLAFTVKAYAQTQEQLPNGGFENWFTRSVTSHEEPLGWFSLNSLKKFGYPASTLKSTDAHSGNYAALLQTTSGSFSDIPGLLSLNHLLDSNNQPNMDLTLLPFHSRPLSVSFWFKTTVVTGDTNVFQMLLTKWNPAKGNRDTVGMANWHATQTTAVYAKATIPFNYFSTDFPDSAALIFSTTIFPFSPEPGAKLYVDDIALNYPATSAQEPIIPSGITIYPQPAQNVVHITGIPVNTELSIFDINGNLMRNITPATSATEIETTGFANGYYMLQFRDENGVVTHRKKLLVLN